MFYNLYKGFNDLKRKGYDRLENYSISMPNYSIGSDVYSKVNKICSDYGNKAVVIGGKKSTAAIKDKLIEEIKKTDIEIIDFLWYGGEASFENAEWLMNESSFKSADMIFAIGGGKSIDTSKCLGMKTNKPVFAFPTIASTCAACTSVSIMYNNDGTFNGPFFLTEPPKHTFIDTEIIAKAPSQYMWAGMGDTYAKFFEAEMSSRGEILPHYFDMGVNISKMCVEPIVKYGKEALEQNKRGISGYEIEQCILAIIVTTAMASIFLTAEHTVHYNSGLAHAIFYSLTKYPCIEERHLHGEVVGFGVLVLLYIDKNMEWFDRMYSFNKSVGLPVKLEDIEISMEDISNVLEDITKRSDIEHNPYIITKEMLNTAFKYLESKGE